MFLYIFSPSYTRLENFLGRKMNDEITFVLVYTLPRPQMFPIFSQLMVPFSVSVIFFSFLAHLGLKKCIILTFIKQSGPNNLIRIYIISISNCGHCTASHPLESAWIDTAAIISSSTMLFAQSF